MSRTRYVEFRGDGFWAYDVPSCVFSKFLVDAAIESLEADPWLKEPIHHWRVGAIVTDYGFHLNDEWSQPQIEKIVELCQCAVDAIVAAGDFPAKVVQSWAILEEDRIFVRGHDPVPCKPVALFGSAVVSLLKGTLPEAPPGYRWFYTLEDDVGTIASC